jgi:hypothetical protein
MKSMNRLVIFVVMFLFSGTVVAQTQEIGLFGGGAYYVGDLNPHYHFLMTQPAYGAVIKYNHGTRWSFRLGGYRGKVAGDDARSNTSDIRGLSFESNITEVSVAAEFNFFDYYVGSKKNIVTPYIFGGLGVFFFNPKMGGVSLRDIGTEGQNIGFDGRSKYSPFSFSLPFGLGVKYSLNRRFGLSAEWGLRKTLTDYLDDVSKTYYLEGDQINPDNPAEYLSDPTQLHDPYMERGNPRTQDWYSFFGISLTYRFNMFKGRGCPDQER